MLLLFGPVGTGLSITASYAVLSLSPAGAEVYVKGRIDAGVAILRLVPETASVGAPVVPPAVTLTPEELLAATVRGSHHPRVRLITLLPDRTIRTIYDPERILLSGSISHDRRREVRRAASLRIVDSGGLAPLAYGEEFAQGELLRLERGARIDGVDVHALLGVLAITGFDAERGQLSLRAEDPSTALRQAIGEQVVIAAGTPAADIVRLVWEPVLGDGSGWDLDDGGMGVTSLRTLAEDDERLHAVMALMSDLGLDLGMGRDGYPVLRPVTDPWQAATVRTYSQVAGEALATSIGRSGERQPANRQIVIGEPPGGSPVRAVADVTDRASPIHAERIGLRTAPIHRSAAITTQQQADTVARAMLIEAAMWSDTLIWVGVPDPLLEAGDVISVTDEATGTGARYRVEVVTIPLTTGPMRIEGSRLVPLFEAA
jgi:hypothetical protein